jgi:5'-nucleotidase
MSEPRVYVDLDGVLADFDAHFPALFGVDHRKMLDDDMWAQINAHPSYFRDMPQCPGAKTFFETIDGLNPVILTACPRTNYANAARQKREWVREHLGHWVTVLPVMGGHNKPLFMHAAGDILIDDFKKNTDAWEEAAGVSILHTDFSKTLSELQTAIHNYWVPA